MRRLLLLLIFSIIISDAFSQERDLIKTADSITTEADKLYRSEWASWYGTDIFVAQCKNLRPQSGGYISYDNGKGLTNIFFSKDADPVVLSTISFGYDFNQKNYTLDTVKRKFTEKEKNLYTIRHAAIQRMYTDTTFKTYKNTNLNPVPIIDGKSKKVYVLTGVEVNGVVVFGNDYLLTFDKHDNIESTQKLHKGLIPIKYNSPSDTGKTMVASIHSHLPQYSEFIPATDICTLRLYEKFTTWKQHIVISKGYVSIWDCERNKLAIITKEAWEKLNPVKNSLENNSHK